MARITMDGYEPPDKHLTSFNVELSDLDSEGSGRSETGYMSRERIREGIYKIDLTYSKLKDADKEALLKAMRPKEFGVSFQFGGIVNASMYAGNRKCTLTSDSDGDTWDISVNLVEV